MITDIKKLISNKKGQNIMINEKKFMNLVSELREQGFTQEQAIEEARDQLEEENEELGIWSEFASEGLGI
tara:strand:- start:101 stop:310 length:210 start_codon:yes stop_codon:yes gene_type:complete